MSVKVKWMILGLEGGCMVSRAVRVGGEDGVSYLIGRVVVEVRG